MAAAFSTLVMTAVLLPVSGHQLHASISFVPAMLSVVACFDVLSVCLLVGDYRDRGDPRLLMMACAYSWSLVVMGGYALAFPGAVAVDPPLALTPSMAPYLYIAWHGGFPILLGAAWAPWPLRWAAPNPVSKRSLISIVSIAGAVAAGAAAVAVFALSIHRIPILINGLDTSRMTAVTAPITLPLVTLALALAVQGTRRRTGPERWVSVAVLVCLCDLILTYYSRTRYSLGWYSGRTLTLVSAAVVLIAMLAAFRRLKAQAEFHAAMDPLTGLYNRRTAYPALEQMVARCLRSGAPLSLLSLDLDLFKQVNDRYGHETGDAVLTETGRLLSESCRLGDVVARVGGEEFLILLPDTDASGAMVVAERVRSALAAMTVPGVEEQITASIGVTTWQSDDRDAGPMLRRADAALYRAKQTGKNRIAVAENTSVRAHA